MGGAKNAALPLLAASVLSDGGVKLERLPQLDDVEEMIDILREAGMRISREGGSAYLSRERKKLNSNISKQVSKIRASILLLGPLSALNGSAILPYPGGCSIGSRPIDIHVMGLEKLGISVKIDENMVKANRKRSVREAHIVLPFPSVGATEHLMITACALDGTLTSILNCAKEPEIVELQNFLNSMGAEITGAGTETIVVKGKGRLGKARYRIMGDRIEAGTYVILSLITDSRLRIEGIRPLFANYLNFFENVGAHFNIGDDFIEVSPSNIKPFEIETAPYPGFPTDLQPQLTVLACTVNGVSKITEKIFEKRFGHIDELKKMGAKIKKEGNTIFVHGPSKLRATTVTGKDLRETAALLLAAAVAHGTSVVENFEILFRGYENVVRKLQNIGVKINL